MARTGVFAPFLLQLSLLVLQHLPLRRLALAQLLLLRLVLALQSSLQLLDLDAFLKIVLDAWEQSEPALEKRRLSKLDEMIRARVDVSKGGVEAEAGANLQISYDEFELIVKDIRKVAGVDTHEEQQWEVSAKSVIYRGDDRSGEICLEAKH